MTIVDKHTIIVPNTDEGRQYAELFKEDSKIDEYTSAIIIEFTERWEIGE